MFSDALKKHAAELLELCRQKGLMLATAESCTGGLISALCTEVPGSSAVFDCGFITYSYESKSTQLGVDKNLIAEQGAVSEDVAAAMAAGALQNSRADIVVAVTGIAGPGGGTMQKPVGLVFIAVATKESLRVERCMFNGNRSEIRLSTVARALEMLSQTVTQAFVSVA